MVDYSKLPLSPERYALIAKDLANVEGTTYYSPDNLFDIKEETEMRDLIHPSPGDRIRLIQMNDDPLPVAPGSTGTVTQVTLTDGKLDHPFSKVEVDWDDGRRLSLLPSMDEWEII